MHAISTKSKHNLSSICFLQGNATKEIQSIQTEALGEHVPLYAPSKIGWPSLNVDIFPPVMRLVLHHPNNRHPGHN
jgi:hypothetical protein